MAISARMILLILAGALFVVAALGVRHPKLDLIAAGLALLVLSMLLV